MSSNLLRLRLLNSFFKLNSDKANLSFNHLKNIENKNHPVFSCLVRSMSGDLGVVNIDIEELKRFQSNPSATIIDVREVDEIKETGALPGSINVPLAKVTEALQENNETFEKKFNLKKPNFDEPLVFSCRSGRRSLSASSAAASLGYKKIFNYAGGWLDWEANEKGK